MDRKNRSCYVAAVFGVLIIASVMLSLLSFWNEIKAEDTFVEEETDLFSPIDNENAPPIENQTQNQTDTITKEKKKQNANEKTKATRNKQEEKKEPNTISENRISIQTAKTFHYPNEDDSTEKSKTDLENKMHIETQNDNNRAIERYIDKQKEENYKDEKYEDGKYNDEEYKNKEPGREDDIDQYQGDLPEGIVKKQNESDTKAQQKQRDFGRVFLLVAIVLFAGGTWRMILQVENSGAL